MFPSPPGREFEEGNASFEGEQSVTTRTRAFIVRAVTTQTRAQNRVLLRAGTPHPASGLPPRSLPLLALGFNLGLVSVP